MSRRRLDIDRRPSTADPKTVSVDTPTASSGESVVSTPLAPSSDDTGRSIHDELDELRMGSDFQ